ncbi:hypothetical protein [Comamonas sp. NoAH]|uniref:hypothetical protein n=1 Tax=Comamonas halotolerans TaxID=3041496 RepID=UPI0024E149C4|nr:hypothetical protein [Comamonas sp. NoAH]
MLEFTLLLLALATALLMRPWRLLGNRKALVTPNHGDSSPLWTPLLATLVVLPWLWALPTLHQMPLQLQWSGACLIMLCLGWPLAVPALCAVGAIAWALSPNLSATEAMRMVVWHGLVPASLAMLWGALLRRWLGTRVFVYIFGRGFVGTVVSLFAAGLMSASLGHTLPGVNEDLSTIAHWLMAWGDAVVTGMMCAVFVAYKPQWLATWSDDLYLYGKK